MSGWDRLVLAGAAAGAVVYALGLLRLWRRAGRGAGVGPLAAGAGLAGWAALAIAFAPPLALAADRTFAAHMGQHELLLLVAPLLLVVGRAWSMALWALPRLMRRRLRDLIRRPAPSAAWRLATAPAAVLLLQAVPLWLWHAPPAFEAALDGEGLHAVQHLTFFAPAALFWWSLVHGRFARLGYGVGVLFVFATALHSGALGALLTVARAPLYPTHAARAAATGVAPLADQQMAGLLMWVPAAVVLTGAALALFAAWLGEAERRSRWTRTAEVASAQALARRSSGDEGSATAGLRALPAPPDALAGVLESGRGIAPSDDAVSPDSVVARRRSTADGIARVILLSVLLSSLVACGEPSSWTTARRLTGGDPARGRQAILRHGCGTCHTIPGIPGADAVVGPSLAGLPGRMSLAGRLPNDPDELVRWIRHPQAIQPGSLMPEMGLDEATARDVAAYLYTLD